MLSQQERHMTSSLSIASLVRITLATVAFLCSSASLSHAQDTLDLVLRRAAAYSAEFKRQFSGMVAEETYVQDVRNSMGVDITLDGHGAQPVRHRELRSDILMVRTPERYVEFRDVFEVDGHPVRDRQERLAKLFLAPPGTGSDQFERIGEESARYNIGSIYRNINTPALPLMFLESDQQARFKFRRAETGAPALANGWTRGVAEGFAVAEGVWVIEYQEVAKHTVIRRLVGAGDMPARGRFWIEPATGRVSMTELNVGDPLMRNTIDVSYGGDTSHPVLLPREMRERYVNNSDHVVTTGTATYGRIRRFGVQVDETVPEIRK
jgi:hypothetical protein